MPQPPLAPALPRITPQEFQGWLQDRDMAAADFAQRLGVTPRYVHYLVRGERTPWYLAALLHWVASA